MSSVRVRIAPSPTGPLHIGTARTALFNYLFAKNKGGKFILRIEDTDLERSDTKYKKDIFEGLAWLGIDLDESPLKGGPYAPYRQSERIEIYGDYLKKLLDQGNAFYCFHSEEELEDERKKLMERKHPPLHLCEYRTLDPKEAGELAETKPNHLIRFKTPLGKTITFQDQIRGELSFVSDLLGDFSIAKRIDVPLYNFAVIVDDYEMKISHVIRGEDHIPNTPKQILMIEALGFPKPKYAHLPLILGTDRSKLSKRNAVADIDGYRGEYLSDALFNFIALLGWNPGDNREILSREELIREFSLEKVQKSGAIFDIQKLEWMNGAYIRKMSTKELISVPEFKLHLQTAMGDVRKPDDYIEKVIALEQPRLKQLSEIVKKVDYFFHEPKYDKELLRWKKIIDEEILASLDTSIKILSKLTDFSKENIQKVFFGSIGTGDKGKILWPLRVALSGKKESPGPFEILEILGPDESLKRIKTAKLKLRG